MTKKITTRKTPAKNDDDWEHIWDSADKIQTAWPVLKHFVAIFGNFKIIAWGVAIFLIAGGSEVVIQVLQTMGFVK